MRRCFRATFFVLLMTPAVPARAHTVGVSRGDYRVSGSTLQTELVFSRPELLAALPGLDGDADGVLSAPEVAGAPRLLAGAIVNGLDVRAAAVPCEGRFVDAALTEADGLAVRAAHECGSGRPTSIRVRFLGALSLGHRHIASVSQDGAPPVRSVAFESQPELVLGATAGEARGGDGGVAGPLLRLGVQHILTGYDHLIFLLGLILVPAAPGTPHVGGRLRPLLAMVTAFTVAHSITLGLAALGVLAPSPRVVEPAIALSICYVGVENWFVRDPGRRWLVTAPFGLIHGFGFAGALREVSLPASDVPLALLSFNLGVEAGQLAVLALLLPLVLLLSRTSWFPGRGVKATSAAIALAGFCWFVSRIG